MALKSFIVFIIISLNSSLFAFWELVENPKIRDIKKLIEKEPQNVELYLKLAKEYDNEYLKTKNIDHFEQAYLFSKKAYELNPMNINVVNHYYFYGTNYALFKKDYILLDSFSDIFNILINSNINAVPLSYIKASMIAYNEMNYKRIIGHLKDAMKENKNYLAIYDYLSTVYYDSKKYALSLQISKMGERLNPNYFGFYKIQALSMMGIIREREKKNQCPLFNDEDNNKIVSLFKKAIQLNPQDLLSKEELTTMYNRMGKNRLAVFVMEQALKQNPKNEYIKFQLVKNYIENLQLEKAKELLSEFSPKEEFKQNSINYEYTIVYILEKKWEAAYTYAKKNKQFIDKEKVGTFYTYLKFALLEKALGGSYNSLNKLPDHLKLTDWHIFLKKYILDDIDEETLVKEASNKCKKSEAYFYIGYKSMFDGDLDKAKKYFENVVDLKVYSYQEYIISKHYLSKW